MNSTLFETLRKTYQESQEQGNRLKVTLSFQGEYHPTAEYEFLSEPAERPEFFYFFVRNTRTGEAFCQTWTLETEDRISIVQDNPCREMVLRSDLLTPIYATQSEQLQALMTAYKAFLKVQERVEAIDALIAQGG